MPTPAQDPRHADPEEQSSTTDSDEEHQLRLQFFAVLDRYARNPPERVYWRDAVKIRLKHALSTAALWVVHMRRVTPATVHHVALAVYYYANSAGITENVLVLDKTTRRGRLTKTARERITDPATLIETTSADAPEAVTAP